MLTQIPGIGPYVAMLVIAEVGQIHRFPTDRHLCAWAGLAPTVRSSDGKARLGHISHQGSHILRLGDSPKPLNGSPAPAGRRAPNYERIAKRRGRRIAKVAIARQILTLCYYGSETAIRRLNRAPDHSDVDELATA